MKSEARLGVGTAALLDLVARQSSHVFYVSDLALRTMLYVSPGYERVWGRSCMSLMEAPLSFVDAIHPADLDRVLEALNGQAQGGPFDEQYRICRPDGTERWIWDRGESFEHSTGPVFVGAALDITQHKETEERLADENVRLEQQVGQKTLDLHQTRRRLELAASAAGVGFWQLDTATKRFRMDQRTERRYGYPPDGPGPRTGLDLLHPDDRPAMLAALAKIKSSLRSDVLRYRTVAADGVVRHIECGVAYESSDFGEEGFFLGASRDVTPAVEQAVRLQERDAYIRAIFDVTPNPAVVVDVSLRIDRYNPAFLQLLDGVEETHSTSLVNTALSTLLPSDACAQLQRLIAPRPPEHARSQVAQLTLDRPTRPQSHFEVFGTPLELQAREYHLLTFIDVTGHVLAQRSLERSRAVLRDANREMALATQLKDEFLSMMSHELRTPLSSILGLTEALHDGVYGALSEPQVRALGLVTDSGRHLMELISDVLDLSKIEAGHLALDLADVDVADLCTTAARVVSPQAEKKRLRVTTTPAPDMPALHADARRMLQVLLNLLSNAIKFSDTAASIDLAAAYDRTRRTIHVTVSDSGPGIDPTKYGRLFNVFSQVDGSLAREHEGAGLGLALVRRMVEMHGGSVAVTAPGRGSCFSVELPVEGPLGASAHCPDGLAGNDTRPRAILASRPSGFSQMARTALEQLGYEIVECETGPDALAVAGSRPVAAAIVDVHVPGLGGLTVLRRLAEMNTTQLLVAITSVSIPGDETRCRAAGARALVIGPVRVEALRDALSA